MRKCVSCLQSKYPDRFPPPDESGRASNFCKDCEPSTEKQVGYMKFLLATKQKPGHWRNHIDIYGKTKRQAMNFINYMLELPDRTDIVIRRRAVN